VGEAGDVAGLHGPAGSVVVAESLRSSLQKRKR
jgi:hypothetical protein